MGPTGHERRHQRHRPAREQACPPLLDPPHRRTGDQAEPDARQIHEPLRQERPDEQRHVGGQRRAHRREQEPESEDRRPPEKPGTSSKDDDRQDEAAERERIQQRVDDRDLVIRIVGR